VDILLSPLGGMLAFVVILYIWAEFGKRHTQKGKLGKGRLADASHRRNARKKACKLMAARKHNEVALYIGTPERAEFHRKGSRYTSYLPEDPKTLYIPGAEAHTAVVGATGCGKSFGAISPLVRSAIDQGFPVLYFDLKYTAEDPNPSSGFMGYARERGYTTDVFAPGLPESCRCNPCHLLRDAYDAEMARQFAVVLQKNFTPANNSQSNPFYDQTGQKFIQGLMMLAKLTQYPDLLLARAIARMPDVVQRILDSDLPEVIKLVFDSLVSSAGAPETLSNIQSTVANMLGNLMTPNLISALVGETTMPLDLDGRQFLTFGVDGQCRDVVLPMIATILQLVVNRNVNRARKTPLILVLDEIPAIFLPALADWLNQYRSAGLCVILGFQSFALLEKLYGRTGAEEIISGCTTQFIFQLNDRTTASNISDLIGKQDVLYQQKSRSYSKQSSVTKGDHRQAVSILETSEITTFPVGKCILFNRGFSDRKGARIPYVSQIVIPDSDKEAIRRSQSQWEAIRQEMIAKADIKLPTNEDFLVRMREAEALFSSGADPGNGSDGGTPQPVVTRESLENIEDELDLEGLQDRPIDEAQMLEDIKRRQAIPF
jgi:type IV secretory pathway TraG/TraD family ATPase VirD4